MTQITLHGAVGEIGGNKILIEEGDTRIFFDFGLSFGRWGDFFTPYLQPRKWNYISDFIKLGLLPDLNGLYRPDYEIRLRESTKEPKFDGIVLSHPHLDHAGFLSFIRPDIPVYCSTGCKAILQAIEETAYGFHEYTYIKEAFKLRPSKRDSSKLVKDKDSQIQRKVNILETTTKIDDLIIHTCPVDHSVPGAVSFIIESNEGSIVYTGDLRFHGRRGKESDDFVEKAKSFDPILIISEGTNIEEPTSFGEMDLQQKLFSIVENVPGLITVNFPVRDMDRMRSFIEAAKHADRSLVVNLKQAYTLGVLEENGVKNMPTIDEISIFIPKKGWGIIDDINYPLEIQMRDYQYWEKDLIERTNSVTADDISKNPKDFVYRCDFFELKNLFDVNPQEGSIFIRSVTEPVDEEMELDHKKAINWLMFFGLHPYEQVHCSGHASGYDIQEMIKKINPKYVMPVHTEKPEVFNSFHPDVIQKGLGVKYSLS